MPDTHIIVAILWAVVLGGAGGLLTKIGPWCRNLRKPPWQPPDWALIEVVFLWASVLALCIALRPFSVLAS